ncbi:MAG TPA: hypothetical protein VGI40_18890 [Pirellulaceae bacterium]|jgi:hypothetical protein
MRAIAFIAVVLLVSPVSLFAEQYANGNGQVVHTRMAPVVAHKLVPPFRGVHTYQGRAGRR